MQQHALNRRSIDWTRVRQETFALASHAHTTADTYPAIAFTIAQLKERHSCLQFRDKLAAAHATNVEMAKIIVSGPTAESSPFSPQKEMEGHIDRRGGGVFAHVVVPACFPRYAEWEKNGIDFQQFADNLHGIILALRAEKPDG
jgi:hypothetical protein